MQENTDTIKIPFSKRKLILLLIGSVTLNLVGLWLVFWPPKIDNPVIGNPVLLFGVGLAAIHVFGIISFYIIVKLFSKKPGLLIDSRGVTIYSRHGAPEPIYWADIIGFHKSENHGKKFLFVSLKNPQTYIDREKRRIKRHMMKLNLKKHGSPLGISANTLQIKFGELESLLNRRFADSRKATQSANIDEQE